MWFLWMKGFRSCSLQLHPFHEMSPYQTHPFCVPCWGSVQRSVEVRQAKRSFARTDGQSKCQKKRKAMNPAEILWWYGILWWSDFRIIVLISFLLAGATIILHSKLFEDAISHCPCHFDMPGMADVNGAWFAVHCLQLQVQSFSQKAGRHHKV